MVRLLARGPSSAWASLADRADAAQDAHRPADPSGDAQPGSARTMRTPG